MTFILAVLAVTFLMGVLIGSSLTERVLESRTRRQAAMQRALNSQLQELEAAWRILLSTAAENLIQPTFHDGRQRVGYEQSGSTALLR